MAETGEPTRLKREVNEWAQGLVASYSYSMRRTARVRAPKVIRDAVWDYHRFKPYEMHLINSPFLQRLRGISQTSLASYTYPSATHNRFQHTLGVVMVLDRLADAVRNNEHNNVLDDPRTMQELRLAALLHDLGHGVFSHASEEFYGHHDGAIAEYRAELDADGAAPHELMTHLIIGSEAFREFFRQTQLLYPEDQCDVSLDRIGDMIIGRENEAEIYWYLSQFINGVFDVDKLDYITRDAHSSGLKLSIDIDRLAYTMRIQEFEDHLHLAVDIAGTPVIEQMIFDKMLLTSSIYHHHKVRAANCMLWGLFEISRRGGGGRKFETAVDFLRASEYECLNAMEAKDEFAIMAQALGERRLLKRALVVSRGTIQDPDSVGEFKDLVKAVREPQNVELLRELWYQQIVEDGLDGGYPREYFWWDFPNPPQFREPSQCLVRRSTDVCLLEEMFNLDDWSKAYTDNNLKAHAFCPADLDRAKIADIAKRTFEDVAGVELNQLAVDLTKIDPTNPV